MTILFGQNAGTYDPTFGEFISDNHIRLAAVLHDYKPTLSLVFIPKKDRADGDSKPYAILERDPRFGEHIIRYLSEDEMRRPEEILAWVFAGDQDKQSTSTILDRLDKEATAKQLLDLKQQQDDIEDASDHMSFYLSGGRQKLNYIRYNKHEKVNR